MKPAPLLPILLGGLIWLVWAGTGPANIPVTLLGLGVMLIVPLGVSTRTAWWALPCGIPLLIALRLPRGLLAGVLAMPWLGLTLALAIGGTLRLLRRGGQEPSERCIDTGHVLVLVGGVWALLDRLGAQPLGYSPLLVELTAVHFHFAGFALPLLAGMLGRERPTGTPRWISIGILAGIPLVAGGLVISQLTGWTAAEWLPSWLLAATGMGVALGQIRDARHQPALRALLLVLSGAALLVGMVLAGAWGLARAWLLPWPTMFDMFTLHGLLNAGGFSLLGLLARHQATASPPLPSPPLQHLRGAGHIGRGWFVRQGIADPNTPPPPGQLERLEDLQQPGLELDAVHPDVRHFYEHTDQYDLLVRPRWSPWISPLVPWIVGMSARVGQLVLPVDTGDWQRVCVDMLAARRPHAGPSDLRLYERHYEDGRPMFIAAYATFQVAGRGRLAVALPLPGAAIVSVMAMDNAPEGAITLRTRPDPGGDPCGFYLTIGRLLIRLPGHEELQLGPSPAGLIATHRVTVLGLRVLRMDYRLPRR